MMVAYGCRDARSSTVYQHYQKMLVEASYQKVNHQAALNLEKVMLF
jgi:hypothetical protein